MIKSLIFGVIFVIGAVIGLSIYLAPDDLSSCQSTPTDGQCVSVDAIVAISGGDTQARTKEAIDLYNRGWGNMLVFSGAAEDKSGPSNAEAMRRTAIEAGVPSDNILVEEDAETTSQNAKNSQVILQNNRIKSIILVTSAYHQRRAMLEFEKAAGDTVSVMSHPVKTDNQWSVWWWLTPQGWYLAVSELGKVVALYAGGSS